MERAVIIGGGGHARSLVSMAPDHARPTHYVDPTPSMGLGWLGDDAAFLANEAWADAPVIIAYVSPNASSMAERRRLIERYRGRRFATIVADDATVAPDTVIGKGTAVFHNAVINTGAFIGDHAVVNTGAIVEHDAQIGENTFIGPGAIICGGAVIEEDVYVGAGAVVRPGVRITRGVTIAMGAVVFKDIKTAGTFIGNPAKALRWGHSS